MKRYLEHVRSKEPHERRRHALQAAGVVTGLFVVAWLATLPVRLNTDSIAQQEAQSSQTAAVAAAQEEGAHLEVASTTLYNY